MTLTRLRTTLLLAALAALVAAGCGKKEISELQRKEAAHVVSEANFAATVRDWPRAEGLFAKAADLCPDTGEYWISLGSTRLRLGNRGAAKDAYKRALAAFEAEAGRKKTDPEPWLKQAHALALLGRPDDARARLDQAAKRFPDNRVVRGFIDGRQLDRIMADPAFKEIAL